MSDIADVASSLAAACLQRSYEAGKTISIPALEIEFSKEQESDTVSDNDVSDNDNLPDVIYLSSIDFAEAEMADGKLTERNEGRWTTEKITDWTKYIRAARGDEPEQSGTSKWIPDEIRRDIGILLEFVERRSKGVYGNSPQEVTSVRAWLDGQVSARGDEPEQSALSDEDAQWLEFASLLVAVHRAEGIAVDWKIYSDGSQNMNIDGDLRYFSDYQQPIEWLRARLAPKPQRPTAESMIAGMRKCKTSDDLWDWWQDTLEDWHAAGGDDGDD